MRSIVLQSSAPQDPESLLGILRSEPGIILLRSGTVDPGQARYSFLVARPFLIFRAWGTRCELRLRDRRLERFGNPWLILEELIDRYELQDELDHPFPLGGCFGFWGYNLKNHLEPRLPARAVNDLELPDCHLGFYNSLVAFDHLLRATWIIATGLHPDGSRSLSRAQRQLDFWRAILDNAATPRLPANPPRLPAVRGTTSMPPRSSFSREAFLGAVRRAQGYIRAGHVYQVNLAQRLAFPCPLPAVTLYRNLLEASPAPFAAFLNAGSFQLVSSSPELFLRLSDRHARTRPIKGTRPRSPDPVRDNQLAAELQASPKESAELLMITDLLRNDLGRIAEFGSVQVPELVRLERYSHVQHLVATIEARLRPHVSHLHALAACFPGGSITGAPKIRAMEIIDELEPVARGPYTGALGYVGFNRESQFSILIRAAVCLRRVAWLHVGAGIVADSSPDAEFDETLAKARGFEAALRAAPQPSRLVHPPHSLIPCPLPSSG
jgi:para-aminobenzoate synthetase component I